MDTTPSLIRAGCKINLNLLITGVRANGWHELASLFYPLSEPHDELSIAFTTEAGFHMLCAEPGIDPRNNTLAKAYTVYTEASGWTPGLRVEVRKGIPYGMGLGGGSADAAALLRWLNDRCPVPLAESALAELALKVGADVPFFLLNQPCLATGFGEQLERVSLDIRGYLVLICPRVRVSTPWAYQAYDAAMGKQDEHLFLTGSGKRAISLASIGTGMSRHVVMINDFEPMVLAEYPVIGFCKDHLLRTGAQAAAMSGSGAAVFGIFQTMEQAEFARTSMVPEVIAGSYVHVLG